MFVTLRGLAYFALAAAFALPVAAAEIAALTEIPPATAQSHPDLVKRRAELVRERADLRARTDSHNARCRAVEAGSAAEIECNRNLASLRSALSAHIASTDSFNASVRSTGSVEAVRRFTGHWNERDKQVVIDALRAFQDSDLRNWIATNPELDRFTADRFGPLTVSGSTLRFKDGFFEAQPAKRENLLAFESGKAFFHRMKDTRLADGSTLETWFNAYADGHGSVIADMKIAKHRGDNLAELGDLFDVSSRFGHMFRAQALQLERPPGYGTDRDWARATAEFRTRIAPLLRAHQ